MSSAGQLKDLYDKILGGTNPPGAASGSGDISQMLKQLLAASSTRKHIGPEKWQSEPATDFWFQVPNAQGGTGGSLLSPASATNPGGLQGYGWVSAATSPTLSSDGLGDFASNADPSNSMVAFTLAGLTWQSPQVFGTYEHMYAASQMLGSFPTKLSAEFYMQFTVHLAGSEPTTGVGFSGGTNPQTIANTVAWIHANATNFRLGKLNATFDDGAARDTALHLVKIVIDSATGNTEWFLDGVSQGTLTTATDLFPVSFIGMTVGAGTSRLKYGNVHIWYS